MSHYYCAPTVVITIAADTCCCNVVFSSLSVYNADVDTPVGQAHGEYWHLLL